jgi:hypothetical protein
MVADLIKHRLLGSGNRIAWRREDVSAVVAHFVRGATRSRPVIPGQTNKGRTSAAAKRARELELIKIRGHT